MRPSFIGLLIVANLLLLSTGTWPAAQEPDGTVKITRRSVAEGVGLSWGDGVLSFKGKEYFFSFQASGLMREVDPTITAAELSGQVFNLKNLEDFNGTYKIVTPTAPVDAGGKVVAIGNEKGVIVSVAALRGGQKFTLGAQGMTIELKK